MVGARISYSIYGSLGGDELSPEEFLIDYKKANMTWQEKSIEAGKKMDMAFTAIINRQEREKKNGEKLR